MIIKMDIWLSNYVILVILVSEKVDVIIEGIGVVGGFGFVFLVFINVILEFGIDIILLEINIEKVIFEVDLVVIGEGCLDG